MFYLHSCSSSREHNCKRRSVSFFFYVTLKSEHLLSLAHAHDFGACHVETGRRKTERAARSARLGLHDPRLLGAAAVGDISSSLPSPPSSFPMWDLRTRPTPPPRYGQRCEATCSIPTSIIFCAVSTLRRVAISQMSVHVFCSGSLPPSHPYPPQVSADVHKSVRWLPGTATCTLAHLRA